MEKNRIRHQPRVRGGRIPTGSALLPVIRRAVDREAARYHVSRSFVVAIALAEALGIDIDRHMDYRRSR